MSGELARHAVADPTDVLVLRALDAVLARQLTAGVRDVAAVAGVSLNYTHRALVRLRALGLVDWRDGKARTLRLTCERVLLAEVDS